MTTSIEISNCLTKYFPKLSEESRSGIVAVAESILQTSHEKLPDKILDATKAIYEHQKTIRASNPDSDSTVSSLLAFKTNRVKAAIALSMNYLYDDARSFHEIFSTLQPDFPSHLSHYPSSASKKWMNQIQALFLQAIDYRFPVSIEQFQPQIESHVSDLKNFEWQKIHEISDQLRSPKDDQETAVLEHLQRDQAFADMTRSVLAISDDILAALRWAETHAKASPPDYTRKLKETLEQNARAALAQDIQDIMARHASQSILPGPQLVTAGPSRYCRISS